MATMEVGIAAIELLLRQKARITVPGLPVASNVDGDEQPGKHEFGVGQAFAYLGQAARYNMHAVVARRLAARGLGQILADLRQNVSSSTNSACRRANSLIRRGGWQRLRCVRAFGGLG